MAVNVVFLEDSPDDSGGLSGAREGGWDLGNGIRPCSLRKLMGQKALVTASLCINGFVDHAITITNSISNSSSDDRAHLGEK